LIFDGGFRCLIFDFILRVLKKFKIKAAIFCKNPKYNLYCNHILTDGWRNWRSARILYKRFLDRQEQRL